MHPPGHTKKPVTRRFPSSELCTAPNRAEILDKDTDHAVPFFGRVRAWLAGVENVDGRDETYRKNEVASSG